MNLQLDELSPRESLLARLFLVARSPFSAEDLAVHENDALEFVRACYDRDSRVFDVARIQELMPKPWLSGGEQAGAAAAIADDGVAAAAEQPDATADSPEEEAEEVVDQPDAFGCITPYYVQCPQPASGITLAELNYRLQAQHTARLLSLNHKVFNTDLFRAAARECVLHVVFARIEELRRQELWSLQQRERFREPERPQTGWDHLISEARYVRSARLAASKHKRAMCAEISRGVLAYFAGREARAAPELKQYSLVDAGLPLVVRARELDAVSRNLVALIPNTQCFTSEPYSDKCLNALNLVPVSRMLATFETRDWHRVFVQPTASKPVPEQVPSRAVVPLTFRPKPDVEVRPPAPPSAVTIPARSGSAWHPSEDARLQQLCKEYPNNWLLVSSMLASMHGESAYRSNVELRTPWRVFERFVQLSHADVKDFRGPHADAARNWFQLVSKAPQTARRRQTPASVPEQNYVKGDYRVRYMSVLDGVRKVKKKRESVPRPNSSAFAQRQASDATRSANVRSAQELARMKTSRDKLQTEQRGDLAGAVAPHAGSMPSPRLGKARPGLLATNPGMSSSVGMSAGMAGMGATGVAGGMNVAGTGAGQPVMGSGLAAGIPAAMSAAMQSGVPAGAQVGLQGPGGLGGSAAVPTPAAVANARANASNAIAEARAAGLATSIAGLPMPASVVAAAAARQKEYEQLAQSRAYSMRSPMRPGSGAKPNPVLGAPSMTAAAHASHPRAFAHDENDALGAPSRGSPAHRSLVLGQSGLTASAAASAAASFAAAPHREPSFSREQIQDFMTQVAQSHPNLTAQEVRQIGSDNLQRYMYLQAQQREEAQRQSKSPQMSPRLAHAALSPRGMSPQMSPRVASPHRPDDLEARVQSSRGSPMEMDFHDAPDSPSRKRKARGVKPPATRIKMNP